MLERTYETLRKVIDSDSEIVIPEHVLGEETKTDTPTHLEHDITKELSKGTLTPTGLVDRLDKRSPSAIRPLKEMMNKNWVTRVGVGKRACYSLTARGDATMRRYGKSKQ